MSIKQIVLIQRDEIEEGRKAILDVIEAEYNPLLVEIGLSSIRDISSYIFNDPDIVVSSIRKCFIAHDGEKALRMWGIIRPDQPRDWSAMWRKIWGL
jgi:hypothetical protein